MNRKSLKKVFKYTFMICFITFMALYLSNLSGYSEYQNRSQVELT